MVPGILRQIRHNCDPYQMLTGQQRIQISKQTITLESMKSSEGIHRVL